jgi:hypothetical protein
VLPSARIEAIAVNWIGWWPTPTLPLAQAPGEDIGEAEPEAMLPRHRASDVFWILKPLKARLVRGKAQSLRTAQLETV